MKNLILSSLAFAVFSVSVNAKESSVDLSKIKREINIMSNILTASFAQDNTLGLHRIEAQYFISQGITFKLEAKSLNNRGFSWSNILPSIPLPPEAVAPIAFNFDETHIEEIKERAISVSREAYNTALEAIQESSDHIRELAEQERDIDHEIRSKEREVKDVSFERRHAEKESLKELEVRKKELKNQVKELEKQKVALKKERKKLKSDVREKQNNNKKAYQKQKKQTLMSIKNTLSISLCDYGAGLRNLPSSENVNFILKNAGENKNDIIYIFSKKDIKSCVVGDINSEQLLAKAISYRF